MKTVTARIALVLLALSFASCRDTDPKDPGSDMDMTTDSVFSNAEGDPGTDMKPDNNSGNRNERDTGTDGQ